MTGFADIRRERAIQPAPGRPSPEPGDDIPPEGGRLSDSQERFLSGLSPEVAEATRRRIAAGSNRDPRRVPQDELDTYTDEERWDWAKRAINAEQAEIELQNARDAQTAMEGHR